MNKKEFAGAASEFLIKVGLDPSEISEFKVHHSDVIIVRKRAKGCSRDALGDVKTDVVCHLVSDLSGAPTAAERGRAIQKDLDAYERAKGGKVIADPSLPVADFDLPPRV